MGKKKPLKKTSPKKSRKKSTSTKKSPSAPHVSPRDLDLMKTVSPVATGSSESLSAQSPSSQVDMARKQPAEPSTPLVPPEEASVSASPVTQQIPKKGEAFTLPSGEACVKIPNQIIEKNRKAWDCFILGQFYSDPPPQGLVHSVANGIWSRHHRDITVTKMEGFSFLFRISNAATRNRVIHQRLWQIEGQTMFVAKWEPCIIPEKPELTSAPIWLELRDVPLQFFHEDGLERIAGLVGDPKVLHPSTANKTNLEVAKVLTLIDPRKPLPEAVNVQFDSGEIKRIGVSSPWMPPVCSHCKEIGHSLKRCKAAPKNCSTCNSTVHQSADCPRKPNFAHSNKKQYKVKEKADTILPKETTPRVSNSFSKLEKGSTSNTEVQITRPKKASHEQSDGSSHFTEVEHDSSDISSSEDTSDPELQRTLAEFTEVVVRVTILETSLQMITSEVFLPNYTEAIIVSLVYASNDDEVRRELAFITAYSEHR
ncbi:hypothetical protein BRARA_H00900 [Brassica rapa]|uniref:CCHC-type domain-containing protein n=1 Tax=Brassica campestris TaxID=3711 RepID=A0A397YJM9_BRACM|nr:hypothetical protein BRARA_H00900 [Brassica rapa]